MANLREWLEQARQVSPGPLIGGLMPSDRTLREFVEPEPNTVYGDILPLARPEDGTWRDIRPAVPGMLRDFARAVRFPYDYAHSDMDPTSPEVVTRATETALSLMGGGAFMRAPANSLRMFAGRNAKTADLGALERAQMMEANGLDRDAIWSETGWFKGVDGQWRFEIDDSKAAFQEPALERLAEKGTVTDATPFIMRHPDLRAAYPDLANQETTLRMAKTPGGQYEPWSDSISVDVVGHGDKDTARALGFGLHELQHGVQHREGFTPGSNPIMGWKREDVEKAARAAYESNMEMSDDELLAALFDLPPLPKATPTKPWANLSDREKLAWYEAGRERLYRLSAGEVEARNVEARANMTPEQRRATPPWDTQDVPDADQIVRRDYTGPAASYPADAPLRAPELPAATTPAEQQARDILEMLRSGRASEVTDEMMAAADPQYLFKNYDLPMDEASRMARAREMGFDTDTPLYHGTRRAGFEQFKPSVSGEIGPGVYVTKSPEVADGFTRQFDEEGDRIFPDKSGIYSVFSPKMTEIDRKQYLARVHAEATRLEKNSGEWSPSFYNEGHRAAQDGRPIYFGGKETINNQGVVPDPANIRSRFARFDPRLSHLRNLNAANAAPEMALLPGAGEALRPELAAAQEDPMEAEIRRYLEAVMRGEAE